MIQLCVCVCVYIYLYRQIPVYIPCPYVCACIYIDVCTHTHTRIHAHLWRMKWQLAPVFLPGKSHEQRSMVGYSPLDNKSHTWLSDSVISSVTHLCLTLCDPIDCSPPCSSVHGIYQTRILQQVAVSFSRGSSQPKDQNCFDCIVRMILSH